MRHTRADILITLNPLQYRAIANALRAGVTHSHIAAQQRATKRTVNSIAVREKLTPDHRNRKTKST